MIFTNIFKNQDKKKIINNFFYLSITNIVNIVLPIITFPYLVQKLGVSNFGLLAFATAIISYFQALTDFGFNLTATKQISIHKNDKEKINSVVNSVFFIKFMLLLLSFLILIFLVLFFNKFHESYEIYFLSFGLVVGQCLFPSWFFQGFEKMKVISFLNIIAKLIFTVFIFIFINGKEDFYLVPIFNSLGQICIGIVAIMIMLKQYNIKLRIPNFIEIKFYFIDGWHVFISNISVTLYTSAITTLLGFFSSNTIVGYYSIADKFIQIIRSFLIPLSQALFPYLSNMAIENKEKVIIINSKIFRLGIIPLLCISLTLYFFSENILSLILKHDINDSAIILKILSPIPLLIFLANVFALFTMIVFGRNKHYSQIIISAGIISLVVSFILIPLYKHIGAAVTVLIIEFYVTFRYIIYIQKSDLKLSLHGK